MAAALLATATAAHGAVFVFDYEPAVTSIPDGLASGRADLRTINSVPLDRITDVNVRLNIEGTGLGGFNGDLYATLVYQANGGDAVTSVLLNRPGLGSGNPIGYPDNGMSITLDDQATTDVHLYRTQVQPEPGQPLTGVFQPDGRNVDPDTVTEVTERTALLNAFNGLNPNGTWTLFVADLAFGGTSEISSWSLEITAVPEPVHALPVAAVLAGGVVALRMRRRATENRQQRIPGSA